MQTEKYLTEAIKKKNLTEQNEVYKKMLFRDEEKRKIKQFLCMKHFYSRIVSRFPLLRVFLRKIFSHFFIFISPSRSLNYNFSFSCSTCMYLGYQYAHAIFRDKKYCLFNNWRLINRRLTCVLWMPTWEKINALLKWD